MDAFLLSNIVILLYVQCVTLQMGGILHQALTAPEQSLHSLEQISKCNDRTSDLPLLQLHQQNMNEFHQDESYLQREFRTAIHTR